MTPQEAIELIESARKTMYLPKSKEYISDLGYALEIAIKALQQQPCENCISREDALKAIEEQKKGFYGVERYAIDECHSAVMKLPPVTPSYNSIKPELKPSEDCISRQYLIERATSWDKHFADSERCVSLTEIQNAPSVTPKAETEAYNKGYTDAMRDIGDTQ